MKIARTFIIDLSVTATKIEAMISFTAYIITGAIGLDGYAVDFGEDEMEAFEAHVDARIVSTTLQALDLDTFKTVNFTVHAIDGVILAIEHESGHVVERNSATWTEVVESWFIDREYAEVVESDQPHLAAIAGFIHPVTVPNQSGNRYRLAA